jgi:secretion-regulating guanine nucleotide exchange factor
VFEEVVAYDKNFKFDKIFCGWETTAAITTNGELYIWGNNPLIANPKPLPCCSPIKFELPNNDKVRNFSMGFQHVCILTETNILYFYGRLRNFKEFPSDEGWVKIRWNSLDFNMLSSTDEIQLLASGQHHFLVYFCSGLMKGYGDNRFGQVSFHNQILAGVNKITCGWTHNACSTKTGSVYVWGRNNYGQASSFRENSIVASPVQLNITENFNEIHLGSEHGMVLTETGNVFTWGWNEHGNCGDGTNVNLYKPVQITIPGKAVLGGTGAGFCYVVVEKS